MGGDAGQNYKTLAYMFKALKLDPSDAKVLYGCGASPGTSSLQQVAEHGDRRKYEEPLLLHGKFSDKDSSTCGMEESACPQIATDLIWARVEMLVVPWKLNWTIHLMMRTLPL